MYVLHYYRQNIINSYHNSFVNYLNDQTNESYRHYIAICTYVCMSYFMYHHVAVKTLVVNYNYSIIKFGQFTNIFCQIICDHVIMNVCMN